MKVSAQGFTFAELIIAVSILAMVSFFSVNTYYQMEENSSLLRARAQIEIIFQNLDEEVKSGKITSYKATLVQNSPGVLVEVDTYGYDSIISLPEYSWASGTGKIQPNYAATGGGFDILKNGASVHRGIFSGSTARIFETIPSPKIEWEIRGNTEDSLSNGFRPVYFEYADTLPSSQRTIFMGFSGSTQTGVIISNIRGARYHTVDGIVPESFPIELSFERKGVPFSVFLK